MLIVVILPYIDKVQKVCFFREENDKEYYDNFSQAMSNITISNDDISIKITGPASSYSLVYTSQFIKEKQLQIKVSIKDIVYGNKNEAMNITLSKTKFLSLNGYPLYNSTLSCNPNQIIENKQILESAGTSLFSILILTLMILMASNVLL